MSLWGGALPGADDTPDDASGETSAGADADGTRRRSRRETTDECGPHGAAPGRDHDGAQARRGTAMRSRSSASPRGCRAPTRPTASRAWPAARRGRRPSARRRRAGTSPRAEYRTGWRDVGAYLVRSSRTSRRNPASRGTRPSSVDPQEHLLLTAVRAAWRTRRYVRRAVRRRPGRRVHRRDVARPRAARGRFSGPEPPYRPAPGSRTGLARLRLPRREPGRRRGLRLGPRRCEAALRALRGGQCSTAVAAAVNLVLDGSHIQFLADAGLLAESADSRPFSGRSDGWIPGEGVGAVLLKPLEKALADGDPVHAVLRGGASRHSGTTRAYGMPSPQLQEETVRAALADAGVTTGDIGYVESSATGAALADALELDVLGRVFGEGAQPVAVGSVKGSLGHMEAASAFGQLAKVLAQFRQDRLLPTVAAGSAPPAGGGSVRIVTDVEPWPTERRVLLNSFAGTGGYVSVVLEAPPRREPVRAPAGAVTLPLSADAPAELSRHARQLAEHLDGERPPLHTVGAALRRGRRARSCRAAVVATTADGAVRALHTLAAQIAGQLPGAGAGLLVRADDAAPEAQPELPAGWLDGADAAWPLERGAPLRAALPATPVACETTGPAVPVVTAPEPADAPDGVPQRAAAPLPADGGVNGASRDAGTTDGRALERLVKIVVRETGVHAQQLDESTDLIALGVDSLRLVRIAHAISAEGGRAPSLTALYAEPVLGVLARSAFGPGSGEPAADPPALSDEDIDSLDESALDALLARHAAAPRYAEDS